MSGGPKLALAGPCPARALRADSHSALFFLRTQNSVRSPDPHRLSALAAGLGRD
jgi:hypothetical protein